MGARWELAFRAWGLKVGFTECVCVCMCVCVRARTCVCVHTHTRAHTHRENSIICTYIYLLCKDT